MSKTPGKHVPITLKPPLAVRLVALLVFLNGLVILLDNLWRELRIRSSSPANGFIVSIPILLGLTLIFLSTLLLRRKQAAWLIVIPFYTFIIGLHIGHTITIFHDRSFEPMYLMQDLLAPLAAIAALIYYRKLFTAKSSVQSFSLVLRRCVLILLITICYGTLGFLLFDKHDFHQEITIGQAASYSISQVGLMTTSEPVPYTRRARVFVDSLRITSGFVIMYIIISLFQPLRAKLTDQSENRERALELLASHSHDSEDFFKLWPHDKVYFYTEDRMAGLAYHVSRGVAIVLGAPFGSPNHYKSLIEGFEEVCTVNDWLPAFVHMMVEDRRLFEKYGYAYQKIGEEAIVELAQYNDKTCRDKYFRNINNRFVKQGYTTELLTPPHNDAVISRLSKITDEWLSKPGRAERGFMMGYFDPAYLQQCELFIVRDQASTIQAFLNLVPVYNGLREANYDFLRHTSDGLGNINDYLLLNLLKMLPDKGFTHFNLGLCPLAGLDDELEKRRTIIDRSLNVFYNAGDRLYSFSGLYRFKAKYEPVWRDRFAVYPGGVGNFARAFTGLGRVGHVHKRAKK